MKKLFLIKIILLLSMQSYAKGLDLSAQQETLKTVLILEKEGHIQEALSHSANMVEQLIFDLKVDQMVVSIDSQLEEIRNEVIVSQHSRQTELRLFFGLLPIFSADKKWDTAKIITLNPEAVAGFPTKVALDFKKLQKNLKEYVKENELGIVYLKAFAAKTVELATKLDSKNRMQLSSLVHTIVQKAQLLTFEGGQSISHCITTNYANRESSEHLSILASFKYGASDKLLAHSEKQCTYSSNSTKVSEVEFISANIYTVDLILKHYNEKLGLMELQESAAPYYPTWGLKDYKM